MDRCDRQRAFFFCDDVVAGIGVGVKLISEGVVAGANLSLAASYRIVGAFILNESIPRHSHLMIGQRRFIIGLTVRSGCQNNTAGSDLNSHIVPQQVIISCLYSLRMDCNFPLRYIQHGTSICGPIAAIHFVVDGIAVSANDAGGGIQRRAVVDLCTTLSNQGPFNDYRVVVDNEIACNDRYLIVAVACIIRIQNLSVSADILIIVSSVISNVSEVIIIYQRARGDSS